MNPLLILTLLFTQLQPLRWSDFRGKPYTEDAALTTSRIDITEWHSSGEKYSTVYWHIEAIFDPDSSFTRTKDLKVLEHENGHWLITQIFAAKINKFIVPYQNCSELKSKSVGVVVDRMITDWKKMEAAYDRDTKHSINQYEQKKWNIKIQKFLQ